MTALTWTDIERITQGQLGRTISAVCPFCSHTRRTINQRKRVFAVRLKEPDFAIYNCMHCGEAGYVHPERSAQIIDLTERKRLREEAERREREDKQQRTASALQLWSERKPFRGSLAETYLRDSRGIGVWCEAFDLDESLGFHPSCQFGSDRLPCMVALVRNIETDEPQAVHRTALTTGDPFGLPPDRIGRLSLGPVAGGAVKLSLDGDVHCLHPFTPRALDKDLVNVFRTGCRSKVERLNAEPLLSVALTIFGVKPPGRLSEFLSQRCH